VAGLPLVEHNCRSRPGRAVKHDIYDLFFYDFAADAVNPGSGRGVVWGFIHLWKQTDEPHIFLYL
jgi:hypothetical protein